MMREFGPHESGMHESGHLFIDLPPPHGGLQRLQRRLDNHARRRQRPTLRIAAGALALCVIALASRLPGRIVQHQRSAGLASALRAAMAAPVSGIRVTGGAAIELPSGQADVRVYLVQSTTSVRPPIKTRQAR